MAQDWIEAHRAESLADDAEQARIRSTAMKSVGSVAGGRPERAERVRQDLRNQLCEAHARRA
jgi:hypothetical protein